MRRIVLRACCVIGMAITCCYGAQQAAACTGVKLQARDGSLVYGRTMEFGFKLESSPIVIPRHWVLEGTAQGGKPGLAWEAKYAAIGLNGLGLDQLIDGTNEKGLSAGIFYMPGFAQYQVLSSDDEARTLAPWELVTWMLTRFSTVEEVRLALPQVRVGALPAPELNLVPPMHYIVHDANGNSLVIEYLKGELSITDNPIGVITNSPEFGWHITNLDNYATLKALNAPAIEIDGVRIAPLGQGSGLFGIPGDYSPPSRFVRAVALGHTVLEGKDGEETAMQLFHVLNAFDIPEGAVEDVVDGKKAYEWTQWTSAYDMTNHTFYYHTRENRRVRRIELMKLDLDAGHILRFGSQAGQDYEDLHPVAAQD